MKIVTKAADRIINDLPEDVLFDVSFTFLANQLPLPNICRMMKWMRIMH